MRDTDYGPTSERFVSELGSLSFSIQSGILRLVITRLLFLADGKIPNDGIATFSIGRDGPPFFTNCREESVRICRERRSRALWDIVAVLIFIGVSNRFSCFSRNRRTARIRLYIPSRFCCFVWECRMVIGDSLRPRLLVLLRCFGSGDHLPRPR
jgi:hypothetical protein